MCQTSGLLCGGYLKSIFFDFEDQGSKGSQTNFRRPLLTEEQRERMSCQITASVAPDKAMWHIARIDEHCEDTPESQQIHRFSGPFGAFRVGLPSPDSITSPAECDARESLAEAAAVASSEDSVEEVDLSEGLVAGSEAGLPESFGRGSDDLMGDWWSLNTQWTALEPGNHEDWWNPSTQVDCLPGPSNDVLVLDIDLNPSPLGSLPPTQRAVTPRGSSPLSLAHVLSPEATEVSIPPTVSVNSPHDAVFLLKHYSTTVLQGLTPYRHSKTPWHILFIPHAKQCLAAITMGEQLPHAALCTFFGILSSSACSVSHITRSRQWLERGQEYKQRARNHARLMLPTAYDVPKVAKYKTILMALLTMIQISTVTRNRDQTECYFLETEKFIRLKGLGRRKSRKVRLLHHCYVFERLLHESTFPGSIDSQHRQHVRQAIECSGAESFSYDDLSFRPLDLKNLDQQMMRIKGQEEGENDLHLKYPGVWAATQYPEIFGIPEIYIFLLSAVIRLGRWKDEAFRGSLATGLKEYLTGAKEVENFILRLRHKPEGTVVIFPSSDPEQQHNQTLLETLSSAMQQALTIYFYRKVYNVDPSALQHHVKAVSECLQRGEAASGGAGYGSTRLVWPAYIAAQEASDPQLRQVFTEWFCNSAQKSGLTVFEDTRQDIEKIWAKE